MSLSSFEYNVKSQFGEDGVIDEIFKRIKNQDKICVEFGAWDGEHLSNTWNLWHNLGWSSYLIECDKEKFDNLEKSIAAFPKVKAINAFVMPEGENSLDNILSKTNIPKNFDLLSIDIDGDDYYVFENLNSYRPKAVIVEFNPTVPPHLEMVQERGQFMGASALSVIQLGKRKRYKPVHITDVNIFFIAEEVDGAADFVELDLKASFKYTTLVAVITSYDGIPFLSSSLPYKFHLPKLPEPPKMNFINCIKSIIKSIIRKPTLVRVKLPLFKSKIPFISVNIFKNE